VDGAQVGGVCGWRGAAVPSRKKIGFPKVRAADPLALRSLLGLMSRGGCRLIFIVSTLLLLRSGTTGFIML